MIHDQQQIFSFMHGGWSRIRVVVVGDVMLDKYVWGQVARISPEAPVPVLRVEHATDGPGGAANVAMNLAGLGVRVSLAGYCGEDEEGGRLAGLLAAADIEARLIRTAGRPTTSKTRVISGHQQMLRLDVEDHGEFSEAAQDELYCATNELAGEADAIILSDYAKGALTPALCRSIIQAGRDRGIPVLADPKGNHFEQYAGATTICPNLQELAIALGESPHNIQALLARAQGYIKGWALEYLTVTLGDRGIAVVREDSIVHAPAQAREVFDVSGAGDTVIATLAACLASRVSIEDAIQFANLAAGIVVGKVGTVPIQRHELLARLSADLAPQAEGKIVSREDLLMKVAAWRSQGESIVFTNGCFDLLHLGHVTLLEAARREGDRLVVAINSDDSVRRLKGPARPVLGEVERSRPLAALAAVDAVVVFEDDAPLECIVALRPDVLVKGGDYTESDVVGRLEVTSWNGRVKILPLIDGFSTSTLIARMSAGASAR